jgi:hypothetical protein
MYDFRLAIATIKRLKWLLIALAYLFAIEVYGVRAVLVFLLLIGLTAAAYRFDKEREAKGSDHFRSGRLFYRYGEEIERVYFSLPVKGEWEELKIDQFTRSTQERLAACIQKRVPSDLVAVEADLKISDLGTSEAKSFLRILARSKYGSTLTHFIHYAQFGRTLTTHYFTYLRGTVSDWDLVRFFIASPFTIWWWGVPWLLNQYSVMEGMSRFRESSFDGVDIRTLYSMTKTILYEETEQLLRDAGLLTEEVQQIINIHKHNTVNRMSINNSANVNLSGVSQSASAAPAPALKAS